MVDSRLTRAVEAVLSGAGCVAADEEAVEIVGRAPDRPTVREWLERRCTGEPLAWIVGGMTFGEAWLRLEPGVYVPRYQTEELARRAAGLLPVGGWALDLCTGSGAVAAYLAAAVPGCRVAGSDLDRRAVGCARRNGVPAAVADLGEGFRSAAFDLVTVVAPYVPTGQLAYLPADVQRYEPASALDGGADGLEVVRRAVSAAGRLLRHGGWLVAEVGGDQDLRLRACLSEAGFAPADPWRDSDGDLRGLAARRGP